MIISDAFRLFSSSCCNFKLVSIVFKKPLWERLIEYVHVCFYVDLLTIKRLFFPSSWPRRNWKRKNQEMSFQDKVYLPTSQPLRTDNKVNQSKHEADLKRGKLNEWESFTIGLRLTSDWMKKWRELFSQSCHIIMRNS